MNKRKKLRKYYDNLLINKESFPKGYWESKTEELICLKWLIAYYEGRAGCTPKELLEAIFQKSPDVIAGYIAHVIMLYNWVYHNKIVGF
jgi:CRISPR/Cas system CSM-associated protein Csm2 small subunit